MREKDYVVIIGSANIDVAGYSHESLNYADSNPGKIKFTPGGVGRNIAQNLALLGNKAWLLSAVGSDFYGQSLLTQTNQSGVYVDKCLIVPGENTSSYLSLLDNTGEMLVAINDMNISNAITAEYLAQHREFIQRAKVIVADCNISEEALAWILDNAANVPVFVDPVSAWKCVKVRDRLNQIHTLKPNRLEAETLSGIALSGRDDVAKVAAWFHQHGLNRLVLSMGGDGVYYSDISGENGWSAPIKTNVINVTGAGDAMMAGLASCWVDGMPFAESVRFAQGCSSMALSCEYTNNPDLSIANVISLVENAECYFLFFFFFIFPIFSFPSLSPFSNNFISSPPFLPFLLIHIISFITLSFSLLVYLLLFPFPFFFDIHPPPSLPHPYHPHQTPNTPPSFHWLTSLNTHPRSSPPLPFLT